MKRTEFVLLLVHAADDQLEGRTALQKLAYFASHPNTVDVDLEYQPHYYGPFSQKLEYATASLVETEDLKEFIEVYPSWRQDAFDVRKYTYQLTDEGKKKAMILVEQFPAAWQAIAKSVGSMMHVFGNNATLLSIAAKVDYLLPLLEKPKTLRHIRSAAGELNWDISADQIVKVADGMVELGLVSKK